MNRPPKMMQTVAEKWSECVWLLLYRLDMLCIVEHKMNKRLRDHTDKRQLIYQHPCKCDREELPVIDLIALWSTVKYNELMNWLKIKIFINHYILCSLNQSTMWIQSYQDEGLAALKPGVKTGHRSGTRFFLHCRIPHDTFAECQICTFCLSNNSHAC